jgi:hypothetical protein
MLRWTEFQRVRPDLAEAGRRLLYQFGVGLAFLATVRADGSPRLHPMCPLVTDDALVGFLQPSPKRGDLHRDGRYALHAFPPDDNEDAFYLSGRAVLVDDPSAARWPPPSSWPNASSPPLPRTSTPRSCSSSTSSVACGHRPAAMATGTPATRSGGRDSPAPSAPPNEAASTPVRPTPKTPW